MLAVKYSLYEGLKMLGLYRYTFIIGHKSQQQQNKKSNIKTRAGAGN